MVDDGGYILTFSEPRELRLFAIFRDPTPASVPITTSITATRIHPIIPSTYEYKQGGISCRSRDLFVRSDPLRTNTTSVGNAFADVLVLVVVVLMLVLVVVLVVLVLVVVVVVVVLVLVVLVLVAVVVAGVAGVLVAVFSTVEGAVVGLVFSSSVGNGVCMPEPPLVVLVLEECMPDPPLEPLPPSLRVPVDTVVYMPEPPGLLGLDWVDPPEYIPDPPGDLIPDPLGDLIPDPLGDLMPDPVLLDLGDFDVVVLVSDSVTEAPPPMAISRYLLCS